MVTSEMIYEAKVTLHNLVVTKWLNQELFSPTWWGVIAFIAFSYILCFSLFDKRRSTQILLFGSLMAVAIYTYDSFGDSFNLWMDETRVLPLIPSPFLFDLTIVPLYYMLVYQYSPNWKRFVLWNAVAAGVCSIIYSPMIVALHIISFHNFKPIYNFPVIFIFGLVARKVVLVTLAAEKRVS